MTHIVVSEVTQDLSDILNRVAYGRERVILELQGKKIVAVIPIEDLRLLEALEDRTDLANARAALAEANKILEVIKKELGL